jgi:hypothetical protein
MASLIGSLVAPISAACAPHPKPAVRAIAAASRLTEDLNPIFASRSVPAGAPVPSLQIKAANHITLLIAINVFSNMVPGEKTNRFPKFIKRTSCIRFELGSILNLEIRAVDPGDS